MNNSLTAALARAHELYYFASPSTRLTFTLSNINDEALWPDLKLTARGPTWSRITLHARHIISTAQMPLMSRLVRLAGLPQGQAYSTALSPALQFTDSHFPQGMSTADPSSRPGCLHTLLSSLYQDLAASRCWIPSRVQRIPCGCPAEPEGMGFGT